MRLLLNLIWLIFGGLWLALGYAVAALVMFILIITIPFGIASARLALFSLWPFGRTIVRRPFSKRQPSARQAETSDR